MSSLHSRYRSGAITTLISGVVMFISYRLYLRYLGYEQYGLWLVLSTVLNVVQLGSIGLGPALTRLVAQSHRRNAHAATQRYLATSVLLVSALGLTLGCGLLVGGHALVSLFKLTSIVALPFLALLPYVTALSIYAVVVDLFTATVSGLGRIDLTNYAQLVSQCAGALASVILLHFGAGLAALLWGTVISLVLLHAQAAFRIARLSPLKLTQGFTCTASEVKNLLGFGGWVAATTLVNASIGPLTRILLARFAGLAAVPPYDLALSACYKLRGVWECALRALLPEVSGLCEQTDDAGSRQLAATYWHAVRFLAAGSTPIYAAAFVFASQILHLWLGTVGAGGVATFRILLAATYINLQAVAPYYLLMGMGRVWHCFAASALMAFICLACTAAIIQSSGTLTAPTASAGFLVGTTALTIYLSWRARKTLRVFNYA